MLTMTMMMNTRGSLAFAVVQILLLSLVAGGRGAPPAPYMHAKCSSTINDFNIGGNNNKKMCCDNHVDLRPGLAFHWTFHEDGAGLFGALEFEAEDDMSPSREHWLGFGFSPDGSMVGSRAMIGLFGTGAKAYDINSQQSPSPGNRGGVVPHNSHNSGQLGAHFGHMNVNPQGNLTMQFNVRNLKAFMPAGSNNNGVVNMIYAVGKGKELGHHEHRGSFRLDIKNCPPRPDGTGSQPASTASSSASSSSAAQENHEAAFAAHGLFAILSFLVVLPMALVSAWFRTLIPRFWIYIHVICNMLAAFFVTISIASAFGGVILRSKDASEVDHAHAGHMSIVHHWIGLVLFIILLIQVISGFNRPPLEPVNEDDSENSDNDYGKRSCCCGIIPLPSDARATWHCFHYITALVIIGMSLYQLQSGLRLFTTEYGTGNTETALIVFWVWVGIIAALLLLIKCCIARRNKKTRSASSKNIMPQMRAEEEEDPIPQSSYRDSTHKPTSNEFSTII